MASSENILRSAKNFWHILFLFSKILTISHKDHFFSLYIHFRPFTVFTKQLQHSASTVFAILAPSHNRFKSFAYYSVYSTCWHSHLIGRFLIGLLVTTLFVDFPRVIHVSGSFNFLKFYKIECIVQPLFMFFSFFARIMVRGRRD